MRYVTNNVQSGSWKTLDATHALVSAAVVGLRGWFILKLACCDKIGHTDTHRHALYGTNYNRRKTKLRTDIWHAHTHSNLTTDVVVVNAPLRVAVTSWGRPLPTAPFTSLPVLPRPEFNYKSLRKSL